MRRNSGGGDEILFEATRIGRTLRIAAIDPATGTEVVVFGPAQAGSGALERMAVRKLEAALARRGRPGSD